VYNHKLSFSVHLPWILISFVACLFVSFSWVFAATLYERPIKTGQWRGMEIEYLGGTVIIQINPTADSLKLDSMFSANGCYAIDYSKFNRWALVGCDISANVFQKIDSLKASPLIDWAEPNGIFHPAATPMILCSWTLHNGLFGIPVNILWLIDGER